MIVEMGCLILGVPVGFLLRRKPLVIKITDQVLTWSVRILLLLLGLALGYSLASLLRDAGVDLVRVPWALLGLFVVGAALAGILAAVLGGAALGLTRALRRK